MERKGHEPEKVNFYSENIEQLIYMWYHSLDHAHMTQQTQLIHTDCEWIHSEDFNFGAL